MTITASSIQSSGWKYIATESFGSAGAVGERIIWDAIQKSFTKGEGVALLNYRSHIHESKLRREVDICIISRDMGLIAIEVKGCKIDDIVAIEANRWEMSSGFYKKYIDPFSQVEKQVNDILNNYKQYPAISDKISSRIIVALPFVTRADWRKKGFDEYHHTCPRIIFKDDLKRQDLCDYIKNNATILRERSDVLTDLEWCEVLKAVGTPILGKQKESAPTAPLSKRSQVLVELHDWISDVDWQQIEIGMQFPPGPQRIRGMAGSGKTILLCQKAARMHWRNPHLDIALVFHTRSLYNLMIELIDKWLHHFSGGEVCYDPKNSKLRVLHAWGAWNQPGLYSTICKKSGIQALKLDDVPSRNPNEALALACTNLLNKVTLPQIFDAILIDEGQDLIVDDNLKFEDKQPFYWMAYQALRSPNPKHPEQRRLIWAYDEAQSLNSLVVPTAKQVLGLELSQLIGGTGGAFYEGGIRKAHIIRRTYRSPGSVLIAAHAIGMGLLRPQGMLTGMTNQQDWKRIGYEVSGDFRKPGSTIILSRLPKNSPNPVHSLWGGDLLEFKIYDSRTSELEQLVKRIQHNLIEEKLNPSQNILVITLGNTDLHKRTANYLKDNRIDFYIPTALTNNCIPENGTAKNSNKFWNEGGVTVSRIHRAKGNEADIVYVVGLDNIARNEANITLRNQLFVALTRARGWVYLSGIGSYPMYGEIQSVIDAKSTLTFTFQPPQRDVTEVA
jgi:superfamily I DNA and RNA helicase